MLNKQTIKEFLKPDWRKTIPAFIISLISLVIYIEGTFFDFAPDIDLFNTVQSTLWGFILLLPYHLSAVFFIIFLMDGPEGIGWALPIGLVLTVILGTFIWYLIFCLFVGIYDKLKKIK